MFGASTERTHPNALRTFLWCAPLLVGLLAAAPSGQIAFVSGTEQEDQCVCVLDLASGAVQRIGPGARDGAPVWSPDGSRLAFQTSAPDGIGICLVNADGSDVQRLPHAHKWNRSPRWSPDGVSLAYVSDEGDDLNRRIMVYNTGTGVEETWGGEKTGLMRPVWMPNMRILYALRPGAQVKWGDEQSQSIGVDWLKDNAALLAIGFSVGQGKPATDIYVVTRDQAAAPAKVGGYAEWAVEPSPNGSSVAYESNDGGDREIFFLSRLDSVDVSNHRAADWNPVWSPNSEWIAFESFRSGRRGVYRVYPKTARVSAVAADTSSDSWSPAWSPDSEWIAFVSDRTGVPHLFVARATGEDVKQLTDRPESDYAPAWRPKKGKR